MEIKFGVMTFVRSDQLICHKDVEHLLSVAGKDVIRLAWGALAPFRCGCLKEDGRCSDNYGTGSYCQRIIFRSCLEHWFCQFFNLRRDKGEGYSCVSQLVSIGLLKTPGCDSYCSNSDDRHCGPTFVP